MLLLFFSEVSKHYNSKVSLEHQLPTATQKLKTTDECVVSSLISLVTCTGKVSFCFVLLHILAIWAEILCERSYTTKPVLRACSLDSNVGHIPYK